MKMHITRVYWAKLKIDSITRITAHWSFTLIKRIIRRPIAISQYRSARNLRNSCKRTIMMRDSHVVNWNKQNTVAQTSTWSIDHRIDFLIGSSLATWTWSMSNSEWATWAIRCSQIWTWSILAWTISSVTNNEWLHNIGLKWYNKLYQLFTIPNIWIC